MATDQELIIKLRAQTTQLQKDLNKAKAKMRGFQKNINKIGVDIRNTMLTAFGGAAVLQGIKAAVGSLADFEFQMSKLKAISGATGDEFNSLKASALELGRTTKFTAGEIAGLQVELSKLGFDTSQILASTDAIRKLATVADAELGESAKTLAGTLNGFNLEASESERVANTMAEAFSKSALNLEKFTVGTANSSAVANALGITLEQNTARLGTLVDANIDASKAGTDLRKIYSDLNLAGISYDEALKMVTESSNKAATANKLVGQRAFGALLILAEQKEKVDELTKSFEDNNKELDTMVDIMEDNLLTDWAKFKSAIDGAVLSAQEGIPILRKLLQGLTFATTALFGNLDMNQEVRESGEALGKTLLKNAQAFGGLNAVTKVYQQRLDAAREELKKFQKRIDEGGTKKSIFEFRDLADTVLELEAALIPLNKAQDDLAKKADAAAEKIRKQTEELKKNAAELKRIKNIGSDISGITRQDVPGIEGGEGGLKLPTISGEDMQDAVAQNRAMLKQLAIEFNADVETFSSVIERGIKGIATSVIVTGFQDIGKAIGGGGSSISDGFAAIGQVLAEGMQTLGAAMVAWGIAKISLDKALEGLNGPLAIAAGAALIVAGAALGAALHKNKSSAPIGGGGEGGGGTGRFEFDRSSQSVNLSGEFKVTGQSLQLVLDNNARSDNRNRS